MQTFSDTAITRLAKGEAELHNVIGIDAAAMERLRARAQFYIDDGQIARALIMLRMVSVLDRSDTTAAVVTARLLLQLGRGSEAEALLTRLLARDPDHLEALVALARAHLDAGQVAQAAAPIQRILDLDPERDSRAAKEAQQLAACGLARLRCAPHRQRADA